MVFLKAPLLFVVGIAGMFWLLSLVQLASAVDAQNAKPIDATGVQLPNRIMAPLPPLPPGFNPSTETFTLTLQNGWNLISFPLFESGATIQTATVNPAQAITGKPVAGMIIANYNGADPVKTAPRIPDFVPPYPKPFTVRKLNVVENSCGVEYLYYYSSAGNKYERIKLEGAQPNKAYWTKPTKLPMESMPPKCAITVSGSPYEVSISLIPGWNAIGFPFDASKQSGSEPFELSGNCESVGKFYAFNTQSNKWEVATDGFERGRGYFVNSKGYCNIRSKSSSTQPPLPPSDVSNQQCACTMDYVTLCNQKTGEKWSGSSICSPKGCAIDAQSLKAKEGWGSCETQVQTSSSPACSCTMDDVRMCNPATGEQWGGSSSCYPKGCAVDAKTMKEKGWTSCQSLERLCPEMWGGVNSTTSAPSQLKLADAYKIASQSDCAKTGALVGEAFCNSYAQTWWLQLKPFEAKNGCNPACVVNTVNKTAEVNWRCTGLTVQ